MPKFLIPLFSITVRIHSTQTWVDSEIGVSLPLEDEEKNLSDFQGAIIQPGV